MLWACLRAAQVPVTPGLALAAFVLAQTLGWISLVPGGLGVLEGAMLVLLRSAPGSPSALLAGLLLHGQAEGYRWFDLGMEPLSGVGHSPWSTRDERLLKLVYELGNRFYNYKGLRAYKEKFRPVWRGRCTWPTRGATSWRPFF